MSMLTDIQPVNSGIIALKTRGNGFEPLFRERHVSCTSLLSGGGNFPPQPTFAGCPKTQAYGFVRTGLLWGPPYTCQKQETLCHWHQQAYGFVRTGLLWGPPYTCQKQETLCHWHQYKHFDLGFYKMKFFSSLPGALLVWSGLSVLTSHFLYNNYNKIFITFQVINDSAET